LSKGEVHSWDFQPRRDAAKLYVRNTMPLDDIEAMARFPRIAPRGSETEGSGPEG
jgi:choline-sulfatase